MTDVDLDALVALAEAATPGQWVATGRWVRFGLHDREQISDEDAAFIAACDPQTVLALIERIRELERFRRDAFRRLCDD